jgi:enoyl-CoA hydratase/3-hydroxyacyl-CoA dehydrogenase
MAKWAVTLDVGSDGVGVITLSHPPVNSLAYPVLDGLKKKFDEAVQRNDVKAIVITGGSGKFSAGFDISAFKEVQASGDTSLTGKVAIGLMTHTIEEARKPSVAAIDGVALGGGLELAMACTARISTPKAQLGLPELTLGIIPGFGGTQRLPRLVGLVKAIEMMMLSKSISGEEGLSSGLVDSLSSKEDLLTTARKWALDIAERRKPWVLSLKRTDRLETLSEAREMIKFAREQVKQTAPNLQHPQICLDAIEEGVVKGGYAGSLKEAEGFNAAVAADTSKALIHIFFAQRSTHKVAGITDLGLKPRALKRVGVIGGGLMGSGIATVLVLSGIPVVVKEVNEKFLGAGLGRIKSNLQSRVKKGKMTKEKMEKTLSLVKGTLDYSEFNSVDMVIEAVIENVALKQSIFADLEKYCSPDCVLSSNTSTIDLNLVGAKTNAQSRIAGAHFFRYCIYLH